MLNGRTVKIIFVQYNNDVLMLSEIDTGHNSLKRTYINIHRLNQSNWEFVRQICVYYKRKKIDPPVLNVIAGSIFHELNVTDIIQHKAYERLMREYVNTLMSGKYEDNTWQVRNKKNPVRRKSRNSQK